MQFNLSRASTLVLCLSAAAAAFVGVTSTSAQVQSKAQGNCISATNKAFLGVAKAQGRANGSCVAAASKGTATGPLDTCLTADASGKIGKARAKVDATIAGKCTEVPSYGFTSAAIGSDGAVAQEIALLRDVFGDDVGAAVI